MGFWFHITNDIVHADMFFEIENYIYISILATFDNRKLFKTVYYWEVKQMHEVTVKIKPFDRNTVM